MGQYLAIGLMHKIFASCEEMTEEKITPDELRQEMQESLYYDMSIYDEEMTKDDLVYTLKEDVFKDGLIPFLKVFYPAINPKEKEYLETLERLQSTAFDQWLDLANKKSEFLFQIDKYAEPEYVRFSKKFQPEIELNFDCILLHIGYGKISSEGIYDFTTFFKYCLNETFKEHTIAKALRFYITG
jgi:hypothetical protein